MNAEYRGENTEYRKKHTHHGFGRVYLAGIGASMKSAAAYRVNFLLMNLFDLVWAVAAPLVTILIYGSGASFPGWTFWEVMLMQGLFELSSALCAVFVENIVWSTMNHVREGSLETVLLKPMPPILYMVSTSFRLDSFGGLLGGLVLTLIAAGNCEIMAISLPLCILIFAAGFAVNSAASLISAAASFKWVANSRLSEIRMSFENFGIYPVKIFPSALRFAVTFILPYAAMGCFPAEILLGRFDYINILLIIPAALFLMFAIWFYNHMIRLYEGVGG
ncbi:MAG: ABC-2 family transporter protein [Ruminococcus sp.]|jgi:ABC-2 type transport system permease protein|nr:ABC-2 family transporter protein [Ruminococcus sp.]